MRKQQTVKFEDLSAAWYAFSLVFCGAGTITLVYELGITYRTQVHRVSGITKSAAADVAVEAFDGFGNVGIEAVLLLLSV